MIFINRLYSLRALCVAVALVAFLAPSQVRAAGDDDSTDILNLGDTSQEQLLTTSRTPRPTSYIAENVTVITSSEIERLNAHTLVEVLQTVPGIHFDQIQTPGNSVFFSLQGITNRHVLVQIDGVPQNFISSDNIAEVGAIPVQMIERVEIVKGAASSSWGSALGGVVNVITKSPNPERKAGGMVSGSIGSEYTADSRGEISGTVNRFGYYLTGGNLRSDGLVPGTQVRFNHGFGKLTYDLGTKGSIALGFDLRDKRTGLEDSVTYNFHDSSDSRYASGYFNLRYALADDLNLTLNSYGGRRFMTAKWGELTSSTLWRDGSTREIYRGANLGLTWGTSDNNLSAGVEYERNDLQSRELVWLDPVDNFDTAMDRWSGYLNGIWTLGRLSILPGFRFDHTNLLDDAYSYSLGLTYQLTDSTTLRAYAARGYGMPVVSNLSFLNGIHSNQNIQTVQAGFETTSIPYLWLKGTLFYNNIWKIQDFDLSTTPATVTLHDQVRQGAELELRTSPLYGLSLTGGYTYSDSWDKATKAELTSSNSGPRQNIKLGLNYDNSNLGLRSTLTGNYVKWNVPADQNVHLSPMIWNLHLNWKPFQKCESAPELFFSVNNIFNGSQYIFDFKQNAPRWFEGGLRVRF